MRPSWLPSATPCAADAWCVCQPGVGNYSLARNCTLNTTVVIAPSSSLRLATTSATHATAGPVVLSVRTTSSLFAVLGGAQLALVNVVLTGGNGLDGGCLFVSGGAQAHLIGTAVRQCRARRHGGAMFVQGDLILEGAILENNVAVLGEGGGVYAEDGSLVVVQSSSARISILRNNTATENGGGVYLQGAGTTLMVTGAAHASCWRATAHSLAEG